MLKACSHIVLATQDVPKMTVFFKESFEIEPHFSNDQFSEFVLPTGFRIAFFKPVGKAGETFSVETSRRSVGIGVTFTDVQALYKRVLPLLSKYGGSVSGPPKDHSWGERSFLLIDPDGNRWEITQSPSENGMLVPRS
jgi:catechol 2,3-dioxygenase-like lactoylglutathione lyase family enzyme